jgi:hypothetical protein
VILLPEYVAAWDVTGQQWIIGTPALLISLAMCGVRANAVTQIALFQARAEVEQLAAERERLRIASDLHDLLGHSLSTVAAGGSRWRSRTGWRRCAVKGHVDLPAGGHETCPVAATRSAHRQPPELRQFVCAHLLNRRRHGGGAGCARSVRATSSSQLGQAPPMSTRRQNKLQSGQRRWPR